MFRLKFHSQRNEDIEFSKQLEHFRSHRWYRERDLNESEWIVIDLAKNRFPIQQKKKTQQTSISKKEVFIFIGICCGVVLVGSGLTGLYFLTGGNLKVIVGSIALLASAVSLCAGGETQGRAITAVYLYGYFDEGVGARWSRQEKTTKYFRIPQIEFRNDIPVAAILKSHKISLVFDSMPSDERCSSRRHSRSAKPKALTVRLNKASGSMTLGRGRKFCRVILGSRQHNTPPRPAENSVVEWNCILVFPYTSEKCLRIEMCDDINLDRVAHSLFDLNELKKSDDKRYKGELILSDGTSINLDISFYPRRSKTTIVKPVQPEKKRVLATTPEKPQENDKTDHDEREEEVEHLVHQTIQFFEQKCQNDQGSSDPIMITIGNPNGPIHEKIKINPSAPLFPQKGPHKSGVESIWVEMAGGTIAFQDSRKEDKNKSGREKLEPSMWRDFGKKTRRSSCQQLLSPPSPQFITPPPHSPAPSNTSTPTTAAASTSSSSHNGSISYRPPPPVHCMYSLNQFYPLQDAQIHYSCTDTSQSKAMRRLNNFSDVQQLPMPPCPAYLYHPGYVCPCHVPPYPNIPVIPSCGQHMNSHDHPTAGKFADQVQIPSNAKLPNSECLPVRTNFPQSIARGRHDKDCMLEEEEEERYSTLREQILEEHESQKNKTHRL